MTGYPNLSKKAAKAGMKAGELRQPGIMTTISGRKVDLENCTEDDIDLYDFAWGLGRTIRYGGHIREDYTVAHHSIVMSYVAPEGYRKEALLHDAAEGYLGDIIWPLKVLIPEFIAFEDRMLTKIMNKFEVDTKTEGGIYVMSPVVKELDIRMSEHESFDMGIRPGIYHQDIEDKWLQAATTHEQWWFASAYGFVQRFDQLFGTDYFDLEKMTAVYFPDEADSTKQKAVEGAEHALDMLLEQMEEGVDEEG